MPRRPGAGSLSLASTATTARRPSRHALFGVALVALLALCPGPALAAPEVPEMHAITTAHFVFTFQRDIAPAVERLAATAEALRTRTCRELALPCFDGPVRVHVAGSLEEFRREQPGDGGHTHIDWAAGVAYSAYDYVLLRVDAQALFSLDETFAHEISHIALREGVGERFLPRWFVEGVAIHQAGEALVERLRTAAGAALTNSLVPIRELQFSFPAYRPGLHLAYAESALFLRWLLTEHVADGHVAVAGRVARGEKFRDAFDAVFGASPDELFDDWRDGLRNRVSWWPLLTEAGLLWFLMAGIFVWAYWRRRRAMKAMLRRWAEEEANRPPAWFE